MMLETQGSEALHTSFNACKVGDVIANYNKYGHQAPKHHRVQILEDEKKRIARKVC